MQPVKPVVKFFRRMWHAVLGATLFLAMSIVTTAYAQQPMMLPVHPAPLTVETSEGTRQFFIEIAQTPQEHAQGLMFRTDMPDNRGMLFIFREAAPRSFWMKNTPQPLDLLFIDNEGIVQAIGEGVPFSENQIAPPVSARFVLELKRGTSQKRGIGVGDRLEHPAIAASIGQ